MAIPAIAPANPYATVVPARRNVNSKRIALRNKIDSGVGTLLPNISPKKPTTTALNLEPSLVASSSDILCRR
jgi:hypothetical protein